MRRRLPSAVAIYCLLVYLECLRRHYDLFRRPLPDPDSPGQPLAAIAHVQHADAGSSSSSTARTLSFGADVTAGNFIVVAFAVFTGTAFAPTVTDNLGNTYLPIIRAEQCPGSSKLRIYYAKNIAGGACTVTVDPNGNSVYMGLGIDEYSGVSKRQPIVCWSSRHQASVTACTAGVIYTTVPDIAVFAAYTQPAGTVAGTVGSGFTIRANLGNSSTAMTLFTQDKLGVSGDQDTPFTFASSVTMEGLSFGFLPEYTPASSIQAVEGQECAGQYVSPTTSTWVTTPLVVDYPNATTTHNLLVCVVGIVGGSGGALTTTVTDNKGNTWTLLTSRGASSGTGTRIELWICGNATGGSGHQITITPDDNVYLVAAANEYTGTDGTTLLTDNSSGTSASPTTNVFTTQPGDLTIAAFGFQSLTGSTADYQNTIGYPARWTNVFGLPAYPQISMGLSMLAYGDVSDDPGGPLSATWKLADAQDWVALAAVFVPSSPPSPGGGICIGEDSMFLDPNTAFTREFQLGTTGLAPTIQISKAGGALSDPSAGPSSLTEIGGGLYKFDLTADDTDTLGSLGYSLVDSGTIYGHIVDRVVSIPSQVFQDTNPDDFVVPNSFGAMLQIGGVIADLEDLIPLPNMSEPTEPPPSDAPLIDGLSWIFHLDVTGRDETEALQKVYGRAASTTVIATSTQNDDGTTYTHGPYLASS